MFYRLLWKCLCYEVINAHDLHTHFALLSYYVPVGLKIYKMQEEDTRRARRTSEEKTHTMICIHADGWIYFSFLLCFSFFSMIIIFALESFYFQLKRNKETETKLNWKHLFNKCICKFLQFFQRFWLLQLFRCYLASPYSLFVFPRFFLAAVYVIFVVWWRFTFFPLLYRTIFKFCMHKNATA